MTKEEELEAEIRQDFLDESLALIEQCEESFMKLSDSSFRVKELERIFRMVHSIKGAAGSIGFKELTAFTHVVEECLSLLKMNPEIIDNYVISILLKSSDEIKNHIEMIRSNDESPWKVEELKNEIEHLNLQIAKNTGKPFQTSVMDTSNRIHDEKNETYKAETSKSHHQDEDDHGAHHTATAHQGSVSIRVDAERIEKVLNISGELLVLKSQLENHCKIYSEDSRLKYLLSLVDKSISEMYDRTLGMRMMPLKNLFIKTQRAVWDLSVKLDKPIDIHMTGESTEIDRTMVDILADPLLHIARNSLDHGIENVNVRSERGKHAKGTISLSAYHEGGRVIVKIKDDGGGINRNRVIKKAKEKGLLSENLDIEILTDKQIFDFIFAPGFSTAEKVTDISGRGVGMDVVKTNIEKIKGNIEVQSKEGFGTCLTISLPLTTAITEGMVFKMGTEFYILPMECILQLVKIKTNDIVNLCNGQEIIKHRGEIYSYFKLDEIFAEPSILNSSQDLDLENNSFRSSKNVLPKVEGNQPEEKLSVVLINTGRRVVSLRIHEVLGQIEAVMKPLGHDLMNSEGIAGAAVLGNGRLALVLDPIGLDKLFSQKNIQDAEQVA